MEWATHLYQENMALKALLGVRFTMDERIGGGSFGKVYKGKDKETGEQIAVKVERKTGSGTLYRETKILSDLSDGFGFPKVLHYARDDFHQLLVINLLGTDLEKLFKSCNYKFSVKTVLMLVDQMLTRLEYMHSKGYLHRDIKPENWMMGLNRSSKNVHLIDFGLSKAWRDPNGKHIPYKEDRGLVGTARYASINTHMGIEQSRRDDLESLGYIFIYFLKGKLPWQKLKCNSRSDKYHKICDAKRKLSLNELCKDCPKPFEEYMRYVRGLQYEDVPDYKHLKKLFRMYSIEKGIEFDYNYDWISNSSMINDPVVKKSKKSGERGEKYDDPAMKKQSARGVTGAGSNVDVNKDHKATFKAVTTPVNHHNKSSDQILNEAPAIPPPEGLRNKTLITSKISQFVGVETDKEMTVNLRLQQTGIIQSSQDATLLNFNNNNYQIRVFEAQGGGGVVPLLIQPSDDYSISSSKMINQELVRSLMEGEEEVGALPPTSRMQESGKMKDSSRIEQNSSTLREVKRTFSTKPNLSPLQRNNNVAGAQFPNNPSDTKTTSSPSDYVPDNELAFNFDKLNALKVCPIRKNFT